VSPAKYFRESATWEGFCIYQALKYGSQSERERARDRLWRNTDNLPQEEFDMLIVLAGRDLRVKRAPRGITREEAIAIAEKVTCDTGVQADSSFEAEHRDGFRHGMRELLIALASAGAFSDGRNMADRLVGRLSARKP
jgi:hypothetical protein